MYFTVVKVIGKLPSVKLSKTFLTTAINISFIHKIKIQTKVSQTTLYQKNKIKFKE